jgi:subtilase family serine protease
MDSSSGVIDIENSQYKSSWGPNVIISTKIENFGSNDATFVSVRYYLDDELIGNLTIPLIAADSSEIIQLSDWNLIGSDGDYTIKVIIDSHDLIQESDELNNELTLTFSIVSDEKEVTGTISEGALNGILPSIGILFGFVLLGLALFFGPKKVQKIK